jgi:DNA-binding protein YbaB
MEEGEGLIVSIMLNDSYVDNEDIDNVSSHFIQAANIDTFSVIKGNRF